MDNTKACVELPLEPQDMEVFMTVKVTDADFEEVVLKSDKPTLVDFWAEWCGPCKVMEPFLEEISDEMKDELEIAKLNIDENPQMMDTWLTKNGYSSIPTMMLFKGGQPVDVYVGSMPKATLANKLRESIMRNGA
jgi:thioredoxin 1